MAKITIECCDLCGRAFNAPPHTIKNGMCVTLGYSRGGWGRRQNFIDWSGEVCGDCFADFEKIAEGFHRWIYARKDSNLPVITIFHGTQGAGDSMPDMSENQPSPDGRSKSLLRQLP